MTSHCHTRSRQKPSPVVIPGIDECGSVVVPITMHSWGGKEKEKKKTSTEISRQEYMMHNLTPN